MYFAHRKPTLGRLTASLQTVLTHCSPPQKSECRDPVPGWSVAHTLSGDLRKLNDSSFHHQIWMAADFIGSTRTPSKRLRPDRQGEQPAQGKARSSRCSRGRKWSPLQAVLMALSCLRNKDPAFGMHFRKMFPPSS